MRQGGRKAGTSSRATLSVYSDVLEYLTLCVNSGGSGQHAVSRLFRNKIAVEKQMQRCVPKNNNTLTLHELGGFRAFVTTQTVKCER